MTVTEWRESFLRGSTTYAVLAAVSIGPSHGYELLTRLQEHGFGRLKGGTVYPILSRLSDQGLVSYVWDAQKTGPARKVYQVTPLGADALQDANAAWAQLSKSFSLLSEDE